MGGLIKTSWKNIFFVSVLVLSLFMVGFYFGNSAPFPSLKESPMESAPEPLSVTDQGDGSVDLPPLSEEETKERAVSLQKMTQILLQFGTHNKNLEELVATLKALQQDPVLVRDTNPYTGEMILVRTQSPLPGTRYFHAQYFADENNHKFPQHMSFEFRPGPAAMRQALEAVRKTFPRLGTPTHENADFVQWDLGNGHVVWVKHLDAQDISENPFNAYTEADIGSIRVAVELALDGH